MDEEAAVEELAGALEAVLAAGVLAGAAAVEASAEAFFFFRLEVLVEAVALWSALALCEAGALAEVSAVLSFFFFFVFVVVEVEDVLWSCVLCPLSAQGTANPKKNAARTIDEI